MLWCFFLGDKMMESRGRRRVGIIYCSTMCFTDGIVALFWCVFYTFFHLGKGTDKESEGSRGEQ